MTAAQAAPALADTLGRLAQALDQCAALLRAASALAPDGSFAPASAAPFSQFPLPHGTTVRELVNAFLVSKARTGASDGYLEQCRLALVKLCARHGARRADSLTSADLEAFLERPSWGPTSRANALRYVSVCWSWGRKRSLVATNPAAGVELPRRPPRSISIHTPAEVAAVMAAARELGPASVRNLALRYFAGLRTAETVKLPPECIRPAEGVIEVPPAVAKGRRRRVVPIPDNLAAWLAATAGAPRLSADAAARVGRQAAALAGLGWPKNVARHSWCSYRTVIAGAARASLEAGHAEAVHFEHYHAAVTPQAAAEFWGVSPPRRPKQNAS